VATVDRPRIEAAVAELLAAVGDDPARAELRDTPRRVADLYAELYAGVGVDPAAALGSTFETPDAATPTVPDAASSALPLTTGAASAPTPDRSGAGSPVLLRDISFRSVCEHHLLPFEGVAHVAYEPDRIIAGLGGIVAVIESAASRPQLQERLTADIAEAIERGLGARGVLVVMDARHGCVTARGPRQTASTTVTLAARGTLADPAARAELMALIAAPAAAAPAAAVPPTAAPTIATPAAPASTLPAPTPTRGATP